MVIAIIFQTFFIKDQVLTDETVLPMTLEELDIRESYKKKYQDFRKNIVDDRTDLVIKEYLAKNGYGSIQTE